MRLCELYILSSSCPNRKDNGAVVFSQFYLNGIHKPAFCNFRKNIHHRDGTIFYGKVFPSRNCHRCQDQKNVPRPPPHLGGLQKGGLIGTSVFRKNPEVENPDPNPNSDAKLSIFLASTANDCQKFMDDLFARNSWMFFFARNSWMISVWLSSPKNEEKNKTTSLKKHRKSLRFSPMTSRALSTEVAD